MRNQRNFAETYNRLLIHGNGAVESSFNQMMGMDHKHGSFDFIEKQNLSIKMVTYRAIRSQVFKFLLAVGRYPLFTHS